MDNSSRTLTEEKERLREQFRHYRSSLSDDEYARLSSAITEHAWALPAVQEARIVNVYWPIVHRREVDTRTLIDRLRSHGIDVALPVVTAFTSEESVGQRMRHLKWEADSPLRPNRWGVHEPEAGHPVPPEEMDVVIVPALGAGRSGHRIGHGFAYYDEFLASTSGLKVGLVYDACLIRSVPHEAHDVPLDVIVTETEVWKTVAS